LQVLHHFGQLPADIQQKQKYAAWRAAEINKAVKEGRPPVPPPSASSAEMDEEAAMLDELSKLEMAGSSSGALPAAPSGLPAAASGAGTSAAAAALPPPPSAAPSTRLSGLPPALDEDSDWAPPGQPAPGSAPPPPPFDAAAAGSAGAAGGGAEGGVGHHFELPSPPKQRPIETQHSHGAWVPPPPRRFQTFQKVLFRPDGAPAPVRGTVAKVEEGAHPERPSYLVALPDRIATIEDATQLAPELATGDAVRYHGPSGQSMDATVAELDLSHWPPSYLVRLADGKYVDTTDDRLVQASCLLSTLIEAGVWVG
jgi:vacuolar protein sorting-associated protein VTA1